MYMFASAARPLSVKILTYRELGLVLRVHQLTTVLNIISCETCGSPSILFTATDIAVLLCAHHLSLVFSFLSFISSVYSTAHVLLDPVSIISSISITMRYHVYAIACAGGPPTLRFLKILFLDAEHSVPLPRLNLPVNLSFMTELFLPLMFEHGPTYCIVGFGQVSARHVVPVP